MKTGLESLDVGAPEITYSGNQGPKSPQEDQRMMQEFQMAQLQEEYDKHVFEMEEMGMEPMSMQQFIEQVMSEAQMSSNQQGIGTMMQEPRTMAAFGGIMGADGRRAYVGGSYSSQGGYQGKGDGKDRKNRGPRDDKDKSGPPPKFSAPPSVPPGEPGGPGYVPPEEDKDKDKDENNKDEKAAQDKKTYAEMLYNMTMSKKKAQEIKERRAAYAKYLEEEDAQNIPKSLYNEDLYDFYKDDAFNLKPQKVVEYGFGKPEFKDLKDYGTFSLEKYGSPGVKFSGNVGKIEIFKKKDGTYGYKVKSDGGDMARFAPGAANPDDDGDDGDDGNTTPPVIPTDPVTGQYSNQYFIPGASNFYSNLPSNMFNPNTNMLTLANGGRANYEGGGITDLRQGYFLGKLVKSITKPFKKVFKGFKKIAKSPLGKMALMYFGGNMLQGNFSSIGNAFTGGFKNPLQGNITSSISNFLSPNAISAKAVVPNAPLVESGPSVVKQLAKKTVNPNDNYFKKLMSSAFKPENAFGTITGISAASGALTAYLNNKKKEDEKAEYNRRLEEERGNFAPIPVDPVQFAANGGRMGFADGGDDDDDDEDFRQKALGALYSMKRPQFSMGGGAGMPPVTMMSEGQDTQSFGDDESTGMANATPTMANQMPMRPPMMDPRMQQQMMAQRGNPMMNRGMMSMQQPRIMAQEGGMMDMGGMEKDYRNEGGFVPIGGQERADDVPARLSKNEFVFTADAVRNAGGGDIDKGAEIMENMMENLEQGGKVSEASQGLSGAREMFATSQRLEEVL